MAVVGGNRILMIFDTGAPVSLVLTPNPQTLLWSYTILMAVQLTFKLEIRRTHYTNEKNWAGRAISVIYKL